jgi:MFS family permease
LHFFLGFAAAAQIGGRLLDRIGARQPMVLGCALAAVGFYLWAGRVTELDLSSQIWFVVLAGGGMGLMLTPASTDAVNRAGPLSYGEATGITQTVRNYAASLGLAILGTILVTELRSRLTSSLVAKGTPAAQASAIPRFVRLDFAYATRSVLLVMAGVMAAATVVALFGLRPGVTARASTGATRLANS